MDFYVSKLTPSDTISIQKLIDGFLSGEENPTEEHLKMILSDDRTYLCIAQAKNKIVGYALAYRFPSIYSTNYLAYLYDIEVLKEHRKKGVGKEIIKNMKQHLKQDGVTELWLGTATDNESGQALFDNTGASKSNETFNDFTYEL